jgi:hypothetical protein
VRTAFYLLIGLIGISPALLFVDGPIIHGLLTAYTAVMVAIAGLSIRPGEASYLSQIIRPIFIFATIPAAWMLIQILPMPVSSIVHPIWTSAQAALNHVVIGSISIDRGATLLALINYCFTAGVIFVASAVTIDRARAEFVLFWLAGMTTLAAVMLIGRRVGTFQLFADIAPAATSDSLTALSALGVIINATAMVRAIERYETGQTSLDVPFAKFIRTLIMCVVALTICACAIIIFTNTPVIFATLSGFVTFVIVMAIRRLGLGLWVSAVIALTAIIVAIVIITANSSSGDLMLRFASDSPRVSVQVAQSVLSDTRWMGNGAGALGSILPIYQDIDRVVVGPYAPTTAATIAIELGPPALWVILFMAVLLFTQLLRGALQRGRDSFYPIAGASCVVLLMFEAFCDAALFERATIIISATILGLAFAQNVSRTTR